MERVDVGPLMYSIALAAFSRMLLNYLEGQTVRVIPGGNLRVVAFARQRMGLYKNVATIMQVSSGVVVTVCKNVYGTAEANKIALISIVFQVMIFVGLMNHAQRPRRIR